MANDPIVTSDLTRPLGLPKPPTGGRARFVGPVAAGAIVLAAVAAAFVFRDDLIALAGFQAGGAGQVVVAREEPAEPALPQPAMRQTVSAADRPRDDGEPALRELQPDGDLVEPVAVPARRPAALAHLPDPELVEKSPLGLLPVRSPDGLRPMDVYATPPQTEGNFGVARVVLVVGGLGISQTTTERAIRTLPSSVTLAFAPYGNSLMRWMGAARKAGHELMVQLPMEPFGYPQSNAGPRTLHTGAGERKNMTNLHWTLARITNYVGVMNFLGGKMLSEPDSLKPIFDDLAGRGLLFLDDGTARASKSASAAASAALPHASADMVIDAVRTRAAIVKRLEELQARAKRTGLAIGTATAFPLTLDLLAEFAAKADERGVEITPISAIIDDPER